MPWQLISLYSIGQQIKPAISTTGNNKENIGSSDPNDCHKWKGLIHFVDN